MSYSQELSKINNPRFEDLLRIASNNISDVKRKCPWIGLSHGVRLLSTEDELAQYLCAYGKMHKEKLDSAFEAVQNPVECFGKELTIIDWGCGQGLASICFFDYVHNLGIAPNINKVILIEPSYIALNRAKEHLCKYIDAEKIILVNKYINDVRECDIMELSGKVLHFFSNILDIETVDVKYLSDLIKFNISNEQFFFCVGPQNIGASRISEFANNFDIKEEDLIKRFSGNLSGRGTINLLVFRIATEFLEVVKVEFKCHRNIPIDTCSYLQHILKDSNKNASVPDKALQFYKSVVELEQMKTSDARDNRFCYPVKIVTDNGIKLNVDIQYDKDFEILFRENKNEKWPKNLNLEIGLILSDKLYFLFHYCIPYEDIKDIDVGKEYVSMDLSSFSLKNNIAEELEIGKEQFDVIESVIGDRSATLEDLENILKESVSNDVKLDRNLYLSLISGNPALSQISSELRKLDEYNDGILLKQFLCGNLIDNVADVYDEDVLLQIKSTDESQRRAIAKALSSKISVITGPPGTGKTQVILNLIANAYIKGKSVLVASKNNKAVDNIKERYDDIDPIHYLLRFGTKDTINSQVLPYLENMLSEIPKMSIDYQQYLNLHDQYEEYCNIIHKGRNQLLELKTLEEECHLLPEKINSKTYELDTIETEYCKEKNSLSEKYQDIFELSLSYEEKDWKAKLNIIRKGVNDIQSKYSGLKKYIFDWFEKKKYAKKVLDDILGMPEQYIQIIDEKSNITSVENIKSGKDILRLYSIEKDVVSNIISCVLDCKKTNENYNTNLIDCKNECERLKDRLRECKKRMYELTSQYDDILKKIEFARDGIKNISVELFKFEVLRRFKNDNVSVCISRYKNYLPDRIPWKRDELSIYINDALSFVNIFKLNAVTNLSVKNSYPLSESFFDMVIIDEASQCDVASALPLIYRAKQLVVIGDPLQLKHISAVRVDEELAIKEYLGIEENPFIKYSDYSLWDYCKDIITTAKENNRPIVLDSHYRCHPHIIGYSNRMFYEKKLGITLNVKTTGTKKLLQKGIIWEDVVGVQKSKILNINDAEVKRCISLAIELSNKYPDITIGIISPFKDQVKEINKNIPSSIKNRIEVNTVHAFQGDERDVIIYSLVVTDNSPTSKIRWIDRSVPNLVNVAVTRAKTAVYVVGNKKYVKTQSRFDLPLGNLVDYVDKQFVLSIEPVKTYIIDTNIFVECPDIIERINPRDNIIIPMKVIDELDKLKMKLDGEFKKNAEYSLRNINKQKNKKVRVERSDDSYLPSDFSVKSNDNLILSIAVKFSNQNPILLTNDNGLQIKAKGLFVKTQNLNVFLNN